jgi:hypothetical protein
LAPCTLEHLSVCLSNRQRRSYSGSGKRSFAPSQDFFVRDLRPEHFQEKMVVSIKGALENIERAGNDIEDLEEAIKEAEEAGLDDIPGEDRQKLRCELHL